MLARLERKLRWLAIPHLTLYLVAGQALVYVLMIARPELIDQLLLIPSRVAQGEIWRLVLFLFIPPTVSTDPVNMIFLFFGLYLFYLMGTALENHWGSFHYTLYILIAYLATISVVWVQLNSAATNMFIGGSVFLAFAFLYPDFVLYLFFILPVKIKWLALITWIGYGVALWLGDWLTRAMVLAATLNFLLFFGRDLIQKARHGRRRMKAQAASAAQEDEPFHRCVICQRTERSDPKLEFRYCPECAGAPCYCMDHIHQHEHR